MEPVIPVSSCNSDIGKFDPSMFGMDDVDPPSSDIPSTVEDHEIVTRNVKSINDSPEWMTLPVDPLVAPPPTLEPNESPAQYEILTPCVSPPTASPASCRTRDFFKTVRLVYRNV